MIVCAIMPVAATPDANISPAVLSEVAAGPAAQLAAIESNAGAMALFTSTMGTSLGLKDASGILGARGLSAQVAKELGLAELSQSAHELIAALAAWQLAESVHRAQSSDPSSAPTSLPSQVQQEWMNSASRLPSLTDFFRLMANQSTSASSPSAPQTTRTELLHAAHQVTSEAQQRALAAWWSLYGWKDRVRQARGLARLCGTWQWIIHNHQNHQEQKMVMVFPPAGQAPAHVPQPVETVVLGDSIYLRWEHSGYVQEDSLLFVKEGLKDILRIEGSFMNNTGGWGSITGKRTAGCRP
jgi:hypothetical protein